MCEITEVFSLFSHSHVIAIITVILLYRLFTPLLPVRESHVTLHVTTRINNSLPAHQFTYHQHQEKFWITSKSLSFYPISLYLTFLESPRRHESIASLTRTADARVPELHDDLLGEQEKFWITSKSLSFYSISLYLTLLESPRRREYIAPSTRTAGALVPYLHNDLLGEQVEFWITSKSISFHSISLYLTFKTRCWQVPPHHYHSPQQRPQTGGCRDSGRAQCKQCQWEGSRARDATRLEPQV